MAQEVFPKTRVYALKIWERHEKVILGPGFKESPGWFVEWARLVSSLLSNRYKDLISLAKVYCGRHKD